MYMCVCDASERTHPEGKCGDACLWRCSIIPRFVSCRSSPPSPYFQSFLCVRANFSHFFEFSREFFRRLWCADRQLCLSGASHERPEVTRSASVPRVVVAVAMPPAKTLKTGAAKNAPAPKESNRDKGKTGAKKKGSTSKSPDKKKSKASKAEGLSVVAEGPAAAEEEEAAQPSVAPEQTTASSAAGAPATEEVAPVDISADQGGIRGAAAGRHRRTRRRRTRRRRARWRAGDRRRPRSPAGLCS